MTYRPFGTCTVGRGAVLDYQRLHLFTDDGTALVRDVIRHSGGVGILPVWGEDITLIRQYRAALGKELWEIPAGKTDPTDRSLEQTARRELGEETGLEAERITHLGKIFPSPGYTDEQISLVVAQGLSQKQRSPDGVEERAAVVSRFSLKKALGMIESGQIVDAKTVVALLRWSSQPKPVA